MTPDEIRYRRCSIKDCPYKEFRGSRQGQFLNGRFVCSAHWLAFWLGADFEFKDGERTRFIDGRNDECGA